MIIVGISCNTTVKQLNDLEYKNYSVVIKELPELQERFKNLVKEDYLDINEILIESNPSLSPVIDGVLYSFFGDVENGDQVYVLIDKANENILLGYYCSEENNVKVYEEKKGATINPEFEQWLNGE